MDEITKERTIDLATAKVERGADRIERVYSWEVERILAGVRAALAVAGSIVGLILAAVFEEVGHAGLWQILAAVAALGGSFGAVIYHYVRLRRLYGNYLESLRRFAVVERAAETD
jgi:predicted membrane protein